MTFQQYPRPVEWTLTVLALFLVTGTPGNARAQTATALSNSTALYARAVRLAHNADAAKDGQIVASVTAFPGGAGEEDIYASTNGGAQFSQIGSIKDSDFAGGLCCGTLFELPAQVGSLAPGTLLWAGSVGQSSTTQPMQLKIYKSLDGGVTWSYLSNCASATTPDKIGGGLWEPQFEIAADGALVCYYSDETQAGHSQLIHQVRSYDGVTWQDSTFTVASNIQADRPGMAVVTRLPSGTYFMTLEDCGPAACTVFYKTSADGWNWGNPSNIGTRITTAAGQWLESTPTNAWAPSATLQNGTILVTAQRMYDSNGQVSSGNGVTILTNHSADGSGTWSTMPAPVKVPTAYSNYCPNYSSPLLPSSDGTSVLEFASDYAGTTCTMYFASGPILAGTAMPTLTVSPASTTVTHFPLQVTVSVQGVSNAPVPTGTITLSSGSYSSTQTISSGTATFSITSALATGKDTLTATYSGDSNYTSGSSTTTVDVEDAPGFTLNGNAITLVRGATTGNTATITVTPSGGFAGTVALSVAVSQANTSSTGAVNPPGFSFGSTSPVTINGTTSETATLTVSTTAATSSALISPDSAAETWYSAGFSVAGLLLLLTMPARRRKWRTTLAVALLLTGSSGALMACNNAPASNHVTGTTPGTYNLVITGTSGTTTAEMPLTVTVQ